VTASQLTYLRAGKDAKVPESQKVCYETHEDAYYVIRDAYVHGIMNGEALRLETSRGYRKAQSICLV
jgi:hypothetical protein